MSLDLRMEWSENALWAITPTLNLPQSKPLYPQIHWSQLQLLAHAVPICFEHMLRVVPAKCTFLVILPPPESGTTAQTVNGAHAPITWLDPESAPLLRKQNPDTPVPRWRYTKEYAFGAITPTPNLPHSKTCTHILTGVCCIFWPRPRPFASINFFRKIAKTAKLFFRYSSHISWHFFDPTFDDETVAFWILVYEQN